MTQNTMAFNKKHAPLKSQKASTLRIINNNNSSKQLSGVKDIYSLSGKKLDRLNTTHTLQKGIYIKKPQ